MSKRPVPPKPASAGMSDWELWTCARQQIMQHGDVAPEMAALRADQLLADGDMPCHQIWLQILLRIKKLQTLQPGETKH